VSGDERWFGDEGVPRRADAPGSAQGLDRQP
jgi:hypothetical protein